MRKRIDSQTDIEIAASELRKLDPTFCALIDQIETIPLRRDVGGFEGLAKIVTSQLISREAADAIWARIKSHFHDLTPSKIVTHSEPELMALGLSGAKARTFLHAADKLIDTPDFLTSIAQQDTDKALKNLTSLKGVGPWTAEVYLMFCVGHPDIFPTGDIALRTAAGNAFLGGAKPDEKTLRALAKKWSPWRSVAARILWAHYANLRKSDTNPI